MSASPYSRFDTPTSPSIKISEVRMAVQAKSAAEKCSAETLVECAACRGAGMVTPNERVRLLLAIPELEMGGRKSIVVESGNSDSDEDKPA